MYQDNRDDEEHKIVRMNVPFAQPGHGVRGTYFIGYARYWDVTKTMGTGLKFLVDLLFGLLGSKYLLMTTITG